MSRKSPPQSTAPVEVYKKRWGWCCNVGDLGGIGDKVSTCVDKVVRTHIDKEIYYFSCSLFHPHKKATVLYTNDWITFNFIKDHSVIIFSIRKVLPLLQ